MSTSRSILTVLAALTLTLHGCGGGESDSSVSQADTLTRAQRDSVAARLPIPGARGVGAALQARDAANARTQAHDSMGS
jgi:hypothetical protein